jgi:predicted kinase
MIYTYIASTSWFCSGTVLIENDAVRDYIVSEMNLAAPKYNSLERRKVYNVSWALIRLALSQRCHVVFDATNQTEAGRAGAYAAASEYGVNVLVVFMKASQEILRARYVAVNKERQNAFDKLGNRKYDHTKCSKHHVLVESDGQTDELFKRVADDIKIPFNLN